MPDGDCKQSAICIGTVSSRWSARSYLGLIQSWVRRMGFSPSNRYATFIFDILGNSIYAVLPDLLARIGSRFDRVAMMENLSREGRDHQVRRFTIRASRRCGEVRRNTGWRSSLPGASLATSAREAARFNLKSSMPLKHSLKGKIYVSCPHNGSISERTTLDLRVPLWSWVYHEQDIDLMKVCEVSFARITVWNFFYSDNYTFRY